MMEPKDTNKYFLENCIFSDAKRLQELIDNGAEINARDKQGKTGLMILAYGGKNVSQLKCLINNRADVNLYDYDGGFALIYAILNCSGKKRSFTEYLLNNGANANQRYRYKEGRIKTALDVAIQFRDGLNTDKYASEIAEYNKIIQLLRKYGAKTAKELQTEENKSQPQH